MKFLEEEMTKEGGGSKTMNEVQALFKDMRPE